MSFDTLAPVYRGMEFVTAGGMLQRCRTAYIGEAQNCRRALLLGEGPGRFLMELLRVNPGLEVTCVERSSGMIKEALRQMRRNGPEASRVEFLRAATRWPGSRLARHLIWWRRISSLDCFRRDELEVLIKNWARPRRAPAGC